MQLGDRRIIINTDQQNSHANRLYNRNVIVERHRHRYELNETYINHLQNFGLFVTAFLDLTEKNPVCASIMELSREHHPFFLGTQFHPEFLSRPNQPHPIFVGFIEASINNHLKNNKLN
jgi:CTP synthase